MSRKLAAGLLAPAGRVATTEVACPAIVMATAPVTRRGATGALMLCWAGAAVAWATAFAGGCRRHVHSPEERVRQTIARLEEAFQDKDIKAIGSFLSEGYRDNEDHDRRGLLGSVKILFHRHGEIHLLTRVASLDVEQGKAATASIVAAMASHPLKVLEDLLRLSADAYRFDLTFVPVGADSWQVSEATWRPAVPQDLFER